MVNAALHWGNDVPYVADVTIAVLATGLAVGWGRLVRTRRELLISLSERVRRAEADPVFNCCRPLPPKSGRSRRRVIAAAPVMAGLVAKWIFDRGAGVWLLP